MAMSGTLRVVKLKSPLTDSDVSSLQIGDKVLSFTHCFSALLMICIAFSMKPLCSKSVPRPFCGHG